MLDSAQGLLIIVVTILTILLVVIGIQVVNILREIKKSLEKVNKMLDDAGVITGSVAETVSGLSSFLEGVKGGFKVIEVLLDFLKKKGKNQSLDEKGSGEEEKKEELEEKKKKSPRFFHRQGKKLS